MSDEEWPEQPRRHVVNVNDLRRRLGQRQEETVEMVLTRQVVVGSRTVRRPVSGSIVVESIERGVSAMGAVTFDWEGDCRRCLEVVVGVMEIDIAEIFQIGAPDDSDIIDFDGEQIDLVPVVRDAVALSLPLAPLCQDDCAGPDPDRYPALTVEGRAEVEAETAGESGDGDGPAGDPRWAALAELDLTDD